MGADPSHHRSYCRPVGDVYYDYVQNLLRRIQKKRLPVKLGTFLIKIVIG